MFIVLPPVSNWRGMVARRHASSRKTPALLRERRLNHHGSTPRIPPMFRKPTSFWRRWLAVLVLAGALAPSPAFAGDSAPTLQANFFRYANRSSMIQISIVAIAVGIALLYKK
jgi:hypothetical protein